MKKLLLASIVMIGFSTLASAQKLKAAPKKEANQPALVNATQTTEAAVIAPQVKEKTDFEKAKEVQVKKVKTATPAKPATPPGKFKN